MMMRSSTFYLPVQQYQANQADNEFKYRILHDLFEIGPWRIPASSLGKNFKPNFKSDDNIFKDIASNVDIYGDKFIYIYSINKIFIVWNEPLFIEGNLSITEFFNVEFNNKFRLLSVILDLSEQLMLPEMTCSIAQLDAILKYKNIFPQLDLHGYSYGGCLKGNAIWDLDDRLNDRGSGNSKKGFVVFTLDTPPTKLPGVAEEEERRKKGRTSQIAFCQPEYLLSLDHLRANLPPLPNDILSDNTLGHWDLFWKEKNAPDERWYAAAHLPKEYEARDPMLDVSKASVTIDFGTSSTVVAMRDKNGEISLIRIGTSDLSKDVTPEQYENPTILSFDDFTALNEAWRAVPWRPFVRWADVQCSFQAREELQGRVESGMTGLKSWAQEKSDGAPLFLRDQKGLEILLTVPKVSDLGDIDEKFSTCPFNPLEIYAFFLGISLNNQLNHGGRIFLHYYMTFPVKFDRETRDRILLSFRRGLLRSLPASLVCSPSWDPGCFTVKEHANEPAAYAAAALPLLPEVEEETEDDDFGDPKGDEDFEDGEDDEDDEDDDDEEDFEWGETPKKNAKARQHKHVAETESLAYARIKPSDEGVPFGVFDFGGGTTDIAVGLYRTATQEERDDDGWAEVIDIIDSAGDNLLGGEYLVQLLCFAVVKYNIKKLRELNTPFVQPKGTELVPGTETLFAESLVARSNTYELSRLLRPLWEQNALAGEEKGTGQITVSLKDTSDTPHDNVALAVDEDALRQTLRQRIKKGVEIFFATVSQAFKQCENLHPERFHILLAGNSCRSPLVLEAFRDTAKNTDLIDGTVKTVIHPPLLPKVGSFERVTLKTGVAIGLLKTLPTEPIGVKLRTDGKEAPFPFYVGKLVNGRLAPVLIRNVPYGEPHDFGKVMRSGSIKVLYTLSPMAQENAVERGKDCREEIIDWGEENFRKRIIIMAKTPHKVSFFLAGDDGKIIEESERELLLEMD